MKKTIVKTAVATALAVIVLSVSVFLVIYIASPKTIGKFYNNLGLKNASVRMYEKQYLTKGKTFKDLKLLTDASISDGNEENTAYYGRELVVGYKAQLQELSGKEENSEFGRSLYDYYAISTFDALYATELPGKSAELAFNSTDDYDKNSCLYYAVTLCSANNDRNLAVCIYTRYTMAEYKNAVSGGSEQLSDDMNALVEKFDIKAKQD